MNVTNDPRVRTIVSPTRILWQTGAIDRANDLIERPSGQPSVWQAASCVMRGGSAVLLDFGTELHGGLQLVSGNTDGNRPQRVRVRFGESAGEAMAEPIADHGPHDLELNLPWAGQIEVGNTGFRFARVDLLSSDGWAQMLGIRAVSLMRDLPRVGRFRCSDERLNRIWEVGADTVHLCMQELLWDGIKRDRLVWMGDTHPEAMVVATVFGDATVVRDTLDHARDAFALPRWMNGMSTYSIWWAICHRDWYWRFGDLPYLAQQRDYLLGLLRQVRAHVTDDGRETLVEGRFTDWATATDPLAQAEAIHALVAMGLQAGAHLCEALGEADEAAACRSTVARLKAHRPEPSPSKQSNAIRVLAGLANAGDTNARVLSVDPCAGLSTFYGYYVLQARAAAGDYGGALHVIRRYWGAMLDLGATSFWEDFDIDWLNDDPVPIDRLAPQGRRDVHRDYGKHCYVGFRHSLCHGWAAGPTAWLSEHVLGIAPTSPGFATATVRPNLGDLTWAEGTIPTPHGPFHVRHERGDDGVVSTIEAPPNVEVLRAPTGFQHKV